EPQITEVAQGVAAGPEIVDRDAYVHGADVVQNLRRADRVEECRRLRDLEHEAAGGQPMLCQRSSHAVGHDVPVQLASRYVDRHRQRRLTGAGPLPGGCLATRLTQDPGIDLTNQA